MSGQDGRAPGGRAERVLALASAGILALTFVAWVAWIGGRAARTAPAARAPADDAAPMQLPAGYPRQERPVPGFRLVDQTGSAFDDGMLRGRPTIVSFVFAHCHAACPVLVENLRRAVDRLEDGGVRLVLVTLDPQRDTPATLAALARRWELPEGTHLLSGEPVAVERLLDAFGVARERDPGTGEVIHPPLVLVVDGGGRVAYSFNNPPIDWIVEGVNRSIVCSPSPAAHEEVGP